MSIETPNHKALAKAYMIVMLTRLLYERSLSYPVDYFSELSEDELDTIETHIESYIKLWLENED